LARRASLPTSGELVLVPDEAAFLEAIGQWGPGRIFPVLIDDGSWGSRESIGRFVRGFEPERVVRYAPAATLAAEPGALRQQIEAALARAAGAEEHTLLGAARAWAQAGHIPPGVVVASEQDGAWVAALALAAGHGQPIVWVDRPQERRVNAVLSAEQTSQLLTQIEAGVERLGLAWRETGDVIDAVTLCLNVPGKIATGFGENDREWFALTDALGRHGALAGPRLAPTRRWAWAGQIVGTPAQAAYQAMCSLFLSPASAWVFDGYPSTEPWHQFDGGAAADLLRRAGLEVTLLDEPRQGVDDWLLSGARALRAGLVLINSKGLETFFELPGGRGEFRDAPVLSVPAAVSFVHSWSATRIGDRSTVAGRWMERGAYGYIGSVHEPFLQAFVPTPTLTARLLAGMPWSAAARADGEGPLWKIAVFGDALLAVGRPRPRVGAGPDLPGAEALSAELKAAASGQRYAQAVWALVMLGRDRDAAELASAVQAEDASGFTAELAEAAALAAFRAADVPLLARCALTLGPERSEAQGVADALWLAHEPYFSGAGTLPEVSARALQANLRGGTVVRDALRLSRAQASARGDAAANAVLDAAERLVTNAREIDRLRRARR
jgi:hypothetical protein